MLGKDVESDLSVKISFDEELAIATVSLVNWAPALTYHIGRYFDVREGVVRLDYSHLSDDSQIARDFWGHNERQKFVFDFGVAQNDGPIALTLAILGCGSTGIKGSSSIRDQDEYSSAVETFRKDVLEVDSRELRAIIVEEITPRKIWVRWLLDSDSITRGRYLDDHEIMRALVANSSSDDWISSLQLVAHGRAQKNSVFENLVQKHWQQVRDYLEAYFSPASHYPGHDEPGLIYFLFENSSTVQASRWACEQVLDRARPAVFPRLIQQCKEIRAGDVRSLFQRWHSLPKSEKNDEFRDCVAKAFTTFSKLLSGSMPSDLALAATWHQFKALMRADQNKVVASLKELPSEVWGRDALWNELGPAAREAWRKDLFDQVDGDPELAQGLLAFACLWLTQIAFAEVEPVLLRLMEERNHLAFAVQLSCNGPRQLQLRAKGLVRSKEGALDLEGLADYRQDASALPRVGAQTWLGDPTVERFIHKAVSQIEEEFCSEYPETWGEDEEFLTKHLLGLTTFAIGKAEDQLLQRTSTAGVKYPSLSVKYRQPGKREEGANTPAGAPLGADILFLTRVVDEGKTVIERVTLVQVKKHTPTETGRTFSSTIGINLQQCQDLLTQSEHSYYLFTTAASPLPTLWVTPARLVGNLTQLHTSKSSVMAIPVRDSSCSYADFFLYYLVGLWAGDEDEGIIAIAKGNPARGKTPRHIVEIEVRRQAG
ncbi:hypothetical protein [Pseudomonas cichorii]|uniref:hypothetical protein n=1 Tax=Pseudomonas cichorii TaxID=36746 RepID=UPI001C8A4169|nr:hypothetical protein [Pseudomonas cichorii]MBX8574910.1 hypothetical protein [Pseudomonas cichorii]